MSRRVLLLFAVALAAMAETVPQLFQVHGVVVRPATGRPVKHARVTILQNNHPAQQASVMTGEDGSFHFTDVPQGKYTLAAALHGVNKTFQEDGSFSTGIAVGPGLDSAHIVFPFPAPAVLTLEVVDEEGEPVRNAQATLFQHNVDSGWSQVSFLRPGNTDDLGRVRWAGLEPGIYYAAVGGRPWYAQTTQGPPSSESEPAARQLDVAFPTTYFPATPDPNQASPIQLTEGEETNMRITLRAVPAIHMTIDTGQGNENRPGVFLYATVEAAGPLGIRLQSSGSSFSQNGHGLEVQGLAPGDYVITLQQSGNGTSTVLGSALVNASGDTHLDAGSFQKTQVGGHLAIEGMKKMLPSTVLLNAIATGESSFCPVKADGAFECNSAFMAGAYEVRLMSPAGLYMKSIVPQGASFSNGLLQVAYGASIHLTITAAPGETKLDGIALRDGKPVPAAMVLLIPQPGDPDIGIPRDQSDSDGTFTLPNVHPGRYSLLAIDHGRNLEYHNPRVLAPYLAHATDVVVPLAGAKSVQVTVQPRRRP